jgi:D-alanyl-D-alanine endopeptidase (penicillin-binding protein 7)
MCLLVAKDFQMYKLVISALVSSLLVLAPATATAARSDTRAKVSKVKAKKSQAATPRFKRRDTAAGRGRVSAAPTKNFISRSVVINGKRRTIVQRVMPARSYAEPVRMSMGDRAGLNLTRDPLDLASSVALVLDQNNAEVLFEKNSKVALPIASITKLMTGLIVVEAKLDMNEILTVTEDDVDREKFTTSRLAVGSQMTRGDMLHIALMSSENRAAAALGRNYPGGVAGFVTAMNAKAQELGMYDTRYVDSSGLSSKNVASARDLAKLAMVAYQQPLLREYSTDPKLVVDAGRRMMNYRNTNYLVTLPDWQIGLQKTGFINEAGRCLVMQAVIDGRAVIMVFLDSKGKQSRTADAGRVKRWLEALRPSNLVAPGTSMAPAAAPVLERAGVAQGG